MCFDKHLSRDWMREDQMGSERGSLHDEESPKIVISIGCLGLAIDTCLISDGHATTIFTQRLTERGKISLTRIHTLKALQHH